MLLALLLLLLSSGLGQKGVLAQGSGGDDFVAGEVVVKLNSTADLAGVAADFGLSPTPLDQFGSRPIYRLRITDGSGVRQKVDALLADPQLRVVYAEPNYLSTAPEADKPSWTIGDGYGVGGDLAAYQNQWATQTMRLPVAHRVTRGAGITVAVLDTGVDPNHPALAGRLVPGFDFVDFDNDPREVGDLQSGPYGHGTHVAGLVALVAPQARIMPVRVLNPRGIGNIWVLAEGLAFAVDPDHNPATHDGADVINLSLSTLRRTHLMEDVLAKVCSDTAGAGNDDFGNPGAVVVAAAGNRGGTTPEYPAAENVGGLLAVAASTESDGLATFSTRGSWIQVMAPGTAILSTIPGGQYGTWRGTSMAAPLAAGEAALLRAAFPALRNTKVVAHLVKNSARIDQSQIQARIDAGSALTSQPELPPLNTPSLQLSATAFSAVEGAGRVALTVTRSGDTTTAVSVNYATADSAGLDSCSTFSGTASSRCDYAAMAGTLRFAAGETSKTILIPLVDDGLAEGSESFSVSLSNPTGGTLGTVNTASVTITDNESTTSGLNPTDVTAFFVRQHYIDFLGREPEPAGFQGWQDILNNCAPNDTRCDRIEVSSAFFRSAEFQERGYFIYRFYAAALGRFPKYNEFVPDLAKVSGFLTPEEQEANKVAFINEFMARPEFKAKYDSLTDATAYVNTLVGTAGVNLPTKDGLIADLQAGRKTRGEVLRAVAESAEVYQKNYAESFVVMQYFGYLRRDPDVLYQNWVQTLKSSGDYYVMVNGFVNSVEYRQRFGP